VKINHLFTKEKISENFFKVGVILIPSAISISSFFILISLIIESLKNRKFYLKDKYNKIFVLISFLLIISSTTHLFTLKNIYFGKLDPVLSWLGLFNWIPFFWIFWSSQYFLKSSEQRENISKLLILGTIPVIVTGIGQYFFQWHGPIKFLNGLVTWYQRPIDSISGLTGLFNHANYAGSWLTFLLPLSIALALKKSNKSILFKTNLILIIFCIVLTNSRNAWISSILTIPIMFGIHSFIFLTPLFLFFGTIILITTNNYFSGVLQDWFQDIIPNKIWREFSSEGFSESNVTRFEIFKAAIQIILMNPLIGTGGGSFPIIYEMETGFWKGHSHNIFTDLSLSYGIPSMVILIFIFWLIISSGYKNTYLKREIIENINDRAWVSATIVFLISQFVDVQYYDARISLMFWLLLAGIKCISDEKIKA
jgi:O-antigen ligase